MAVLHVNGSNFDKEVKQSSLPVLVDFWAQWCGPCRMIAPIIEEVAKEMDGKLKVVKVDVDEAQDLAGEYGIMSIPTLMVFKNGQMALQIAGAMPKEQLIKKVQPYI